MDQEVTAGTMIKSLRSTVLAASEGAGRVDAGLYEETGLNLGMHT